MKKEEAKEVREEKQQNDLTDRHDRSGKGCVHHCFSNSLDCEANGGERIVLDCKSELNPDWVTLYSIRAQAAPRRGIKGLYGELH